MKHTLRKYLSSRGSALFMVLSTMTALLIVVMAMYFSVVSSRSVQYAVFNQEQSYQSAVSIEDAIIAGLKDGTRGDLMQTLMNMEIGEENAISSKGNGYKAFDAGDKEADSNLGAYDIQITRLDDDVYDIATTTSVNGVTETVHSQIYISVSGGDIPPMPTQVFASTGYVPNDIYLDNGVMKTDIFFDNENVYVGAYGSAALQLGGNLYAGGSIINENYIENVADKANVWAIRNSYKMTNKSNGTLTKFKDGSMVIIGGDLVIDKGGFQAEDGKTMSAYVLGDVYLGTNQAYFKNVDLYVQGNIYFKKTYMWEDDFQNVYVNGDICLLPTTETDWSTGSPVQVEVPLIKYDPTSGVPIGTQLKGATTFDKWRKWDKSAPGMNITEAATKLDTLTATNVYYKWKVNDGNVEGKSYAEAKKLDSYVKDIDELSKDVNKVKLLYNMTGTDGFYEGETIPANTFVNTLTFEKGSCEGAIIEDSYTVGGNSVNAYALIIDTGDDPDNVFTIRVKGNRDMDGDEDTGEEGKETFMWSPNNDDANRNMIILVKGRGSVVVDIPDGVIYQDDNQQIFMHYGWYILAGGQEKTHASGSVYYEGIQAKASTTLPFIHKECNCTYEEIPSKTIKCTNSSCKNNGKFKKEVYCSRHEYDVVYCPECEAALVTKDESGKYVNMCVNRVDRTAVDNYLNSNPTVAARMEGERDDEGKIKMNKNGYPLWYYPTTNVFLVAVGESANIRLSQFVDGTNIGENSFFGYIYAPYMTYKDKMTGQQAGEDFIRLCGGLTVSDYVISSSMISVGCWPEKMPAELMGDECYEALNEIAPKTWKVGVLTH